MDFDHELLNYLEGFLSEERKSRFLEVLSKRTRFLTVATEDVFQMHNASAVIRSCEAFGIQEAHLIEGRFGDRLDKHIAMGAEQWVDVYRYTTVEDCIETLRDQGYQIVATSPHAGGVSLSDFKVEKPTALFFGTEKEGLSTSVIERADQCVYIPMSGFTESLNISVAVAIMLEQLSAKLRSSQLSWELKEDFILEKRLDWTIKSIKSASQIIDRFQRQRKI